MKRYKFLSAALLGALLTMGTVTSCSDSGYLDINYNPDYPTTATYKQLFPFCRGFNSCSFRTLRTINWKFLVSVCHTG